MTKLFGGFSAATISLIVGYTICPPAHAQNFQTKNCDYVRYVLKKDYGYMSDQDQEVSYYKILKWSGVVCKEPYRRTAASPPPKQPAGSTAAATPKRNKVNSPPEVKKEEKVESLEELQKKFAADKSLNPWKNQPVGADADRTKPADDRAPYAASSCANFKRIGSGITSDNVGITNSCGFPIQVLHCFHSPGQAAKCNPASGTGWSITSTMEPGSTTISIASTSIWDVAYYVCNMAGVVNYSKLCLRPK